MATDVIQFTIKGIDQSKAAFSSAAKSVKAIGSATVSMGKYAAGAATAVVGFTTVIANGIDKQAKFATRLGINIEELTRLQYAADLAGLSTETFNMATQRMTRRVAEAAKGTGEAKDALRELGIDAKSFAKLGVEDQMALFADKIGNVTSESDKLRLAFKLFDSEGTAMLQMLKGGSDAMKAAAADAQFLGLVIDKQAAANAEHFKDSMTRATGAIKGVSMSIAGELMPILSGMANGFANTLASNRDAITAWVQEGIRGFFTIIEVAKQFGAGIKAIFTDAAAFSAFVDNIGQLPGIMLEVAWSAGKALLVGIEEGLKLAGLAVLAFGDVAIQNIKAALTGGEMVDFSDHMGEIMVQGFADASARMGEALGEMGEQVFTSSEEMGSTLANAFNIDMSVAQENAQLAIESIQEFGVVTAEVVQESLEQTGGLMEAMKEQGSVFLEEMGESYNTFSEEFFNSIQTGIDSIAGGITNVMAGTAKMSDVVKGAAKQMLMEMTKSLIKMGIQQMIYGNIVEGSTMASALKGIAGGAAQAFGNAYASISAIPIVGPFLAPAVAAAAGAAVVKGGQSLLSGAREYGGPVTTGGTFLVGERGPELFTPSTGGSITPNNQLSMDGGEPGAAVVIENINIEVLPNATNLDALQSMSKEQLADVLAEPIIAALNALDKVGIVPNFVERSQ